MKKILNFSGFLLAFFVLSFLFAKPTMGQNKELVIVDQMVSDYQSIISNLDRQADVFIIPKTGNPLELIAAELAKRPGLKAIHLFVMCKPGAIVFDQLAITEQNIQQYAVSFASWFSYLNKDSEILIYGSELASNTEGKTLLSSISKQTGATIRASEDVTGPSSENGNWELEYSTGNTKTNGIVSAMTKSSFKSLSDK